MAEDIGNLEARVRARNRARGTGCGVCRWVEARPEREVWDRLMADPDVQHVALYDEMRDLGFEKSVRIVERHRNEGHRRASD